MIDKSTSEVALDSVLVVREFPDVFLEDLPSFPSNKKLEFGIELLPSLATVSIPSYKMAPIELKELKT